MIDTNHSASTKQDRLSAPFLEVQRLRRVWMWVALGVPAAALLLISTDQLVLNSAGNSLLTWPSVLLAVLVLLLIAIFVNKTYLVTGIDRQGVYFRFFPLQLGYKLIRWDDIDEAYVRRYDALSEYGGWGVKFGSFGKSYTVRGKYGLQLDLRDGRRILLGTQKPIEMERQILRYFHDFELY
jgi:hypothetical protein